MKEMIKNAWEMFTEKEKYALHFERINTVEDLANLVEPDWEYNNYKNAKDLYKSVKKELMIK